VRLPIVSSCRYHTPPPTGCAPLRETQRYVSRSLLRFVQKLTGVRSKYPLLHRNRRFLTGAYDEELEVKDRTWMNASGAKMRSEDWADKDMRCPLA
jgi:pullulanase/glycogen debranching enzyme